MVCASLTISASTCWFFWMEAPAVLNWKVQILKTLPSIAAPAAAAPAPARTPAAPAAPPAAPEAANEAIAAAVSAVASAAADVAASSALSDMRPSAAIVLAIAAWD